MSLIGDFAPACIENALAIICACLPTYRPLLSICHDIFTSIVTIYTPIANATQGWRKTRSKQSDLSAASPRTSVNKQHFSHNRIHDGLNYNAYLTEAIGGINTEDDKVAGRDYPLHTIRVKKSTEIV